MVSITITVFIPTFNRASRLNKSLSDLIHLIYSENLTDQFKILVGNNASIDTTKEIIFKASEKAKELKIDLNSFTNPANFGFAGNVMQGYRRFNSDFILFLSDDDNIFPGALKKIYDEILFFNPNIAICNFDQPPYNQNNPNFKTSELVTENLIKFAAPFILYPKLTGTIFRKRTYPNNHVTNINSTMVIPHVVLAITEFQKSGSGLHSSVFFAFPDDDYLNHIAFLPYINNLARKEIAGALEGLKTDLEISYLSNLIPIRSVVDDSINWLFKFYTGKQKLSQSMYLEIWSNCFRYFFGIKKSVIGLSLIKSDKSFRRIKILILLIFRAKNYVLKLARRQKVYLESENF